MLERPSPCADASQHVSVGINGFAMTVYANLCSSSPALKSLPRTAPHLHCGSQLGDQVIITEEQVANFRNQADTEADQLLAELSTQWHRYLEDAMKNPRTMTEANNAVAAWATSLYHRNSGAVKVRSSSSRSPIVRNPAPPIP